MDSTREQLNPGTRFAADARVCLVRSTAEQRQSLERLLYRRYPDAEWGTFFRFGYRLTKWGVLVCAVDVLSPKPGDLNERSPLVEFSPGYISQALRMFDVCEFGVGVIHSHPEGCQPSPSFSDDDMDHYFATEFELFSGGRPYVSLIVSRDEYGQRSFSGRCFYRGDWFPVRDWLTCGRDVLRHDTSQGIVSPTDFDGRTMERVSELLGSATSIRLRRATVGIVGCSGLGTPVGHVLARAGVGELVLVDPGCFKPSNLERNHASRAADLTDDSLPKVDLLRRLVLEIRPDTRVTAFTADILDKHVVDELARCDLVLGCTDSFYARAALGDLATHYLIPVLDLAVQMRAADGMLKEQVGEIARYLPGLPCPWCRGRVTAESIRAETASKAEREVALRGAVEAKSRGEDGAQYWIGQHPQERAVGYMTTVVGAKGAGYAQHWLTGVAALPHDRFQFDLGLKCFGMVADEKSPATDCSCAQCIGFADQGRAYFSVAQPEHFRAAATQRIVGCQSDLSAVTLSR